MYKHTFQVEISVGFKTKGNLPSNTSSPSKHAVVRARVQHLGSVIGAVLLDHM